MTDIEPAARASLIHMLFDQVPEDWDENDIGILADAIEAWQAAQRPLPHIVTAPDGAAYPCSCPVVGDHPMFRLQITPELYIALWHEAQQSEHDPRCISLTDSEFNDHCDCKTLRMIDAAAQQSETHDGLYPHESVCSCGATGNGDCRPHSPAASTALIQAREVVARPDHFTDEEVWGALDALVSTLEGKTDDQGN